MKQLRPIGTVPVMVRTSERSTFARCEFKWWLAWHLRLKPIDRKVYFTFGDLVHQALAAYYIPERPRRIGSKAKRGPHPVKTFSKLYSALEADGLGFGFGTDDEKWEDAGVLGTEMLTNYVDQYGRDDRYRVIAPEVPFQVDVTDNADAYVCTYAGQLDGVVEDLETGHIWFLEHKTARAISGAHLDFDEQATSYWTFGPEFLQEEGHLKPDQRLDGILFNFLRKGRKDARSQDADGHYLNKDGTISKSQPSPLFERFQVYRAEEERSKLLWRTIHQERRMQKIRQGKMVPIKSILNGCVGMYSCEYRDMCVLHETGSDWRAYKRAMYEVWNPYEAHETKG